ncbi:hypothetical protein CYMTET_10204 [Cymbomonas tetramitiformis]|uniref:C2 domain-containing protein n=1 Tax=Cymbomonas tetramitiformis TaxID=36881 RepID=A0AAE0LE96_9CHLO|nr:hypothetical protein CYMTET_10204 [Cymbomonas tetramitiformis]
MASKPLNAVARIRVVGATDLALRGQKGASPSNPYVVLTLTESSQPPQLFYTSVKKAESNPKWSEDFACFMCNPRKAVLHIHVLHAELGGRGDTSRNSVGLYDLSLGTTELAFRNMAQRLRGSMILNNIEQGKVEVDITWHRSK